MVNCTGEIAGARVLPAEASSKDPIDLPVRCGLPRTRWRRRPRAAGLQHRSDAASLDEIATNNHAGRSRYSPRRASRVAPRPSRFQTTSRSCSSRHAHPNTTAKKTSGNSCGRTGCRTEFSNPSTTSSITAATPGTRSSISRGKSCPSPAAIGQSQVSQSEDWYKSNWIGF